MCKGLCQALQKWKMKDYPHSPPRLVGESSRQRSSYKILGEKKKDIGEVISTGDKHKTVRKQRERNQFD